MKTLSNIAAEPFLELVLELGASLSSLSSDLRHELEEKAAAEAGGVLDAFGLAPGCLVRVESGAGDEPLRVQLGGRALGSPTWLAEQLWEAMFPEHQLGTSEMAHALAEKIAGQDEAQQHNVLEDSALEDNVLAFLSALAAETVRLRPERLLRWSDLERVGEALRKRPATVAAASITSSTTAPSEMAQLGRVLHQLLALGIACSPSNPILLNGLTGHDADDSADDVDIESLVAAMRPHTIEVRVERDYLEALLERDLEGPIPLPGATVRATELFHLMSDGLFYELGVRVPPIVLVADDTLPARCCRVYINDAPGPLLALIALDRALVNASQKDLQHEKIDAWPARNPVNGQAASVVSVQDTDKVKGLGYSIWTPFEHLILALAAQLRRSAAYLVDCETVEYELSQLDSAFPGLVRGTLMCVPVSHLTAVIRGLLRENVSVRNLRAILERMAGYCAPLAGTDDRVSLAERIDSQSANAHAAELQFVRIGLKQAINAQCARGGMLFVYLLAPEIEAQLMRHLQAVGEDTEPLLDGTQLYELCRVVREEVHPDTRNAVLLTTSYLRFAVRDLLRDALPQVAVLAWEELSPEWSIQPVARIQLPKSWSAAAQATPPNPADAELTATPVT